MHPPNTIMISVQNTLNSMAIRVIVIEINIEIMGNMAGRRDFRSKSINWELFIRVVVLDDFADGFDGEGVLV